MRLRRSMRGDGAPPAALDDNLITKLLASWPQRLADQQLIRESLSALEPLGETLAYLYPALFRDGPHLRTLFPQSLKAQQERLAYSMRQLIDALDKPEVAVPFFVELGRAHLKLGVRTVHYQPFGAALIEALQVRGGDAWRPEYNDAWQRAYRFIAEVMSRAADSALSAQPYVTATVTEHERRRPDLAVLRVRPTQPYAYQAGQYASVGSPKLPHTWRSYSMADPPGAAQLEFHVRAIGSGRLSDILVQDTKVGDQLWLGPARGKMTLAPESNRGVLLVAGGTGLAAIRSLLGALAQRPKPPATWLFFGARTVDDLYDLDLLTQYVDQWPWLRVVPTVSSGPAYPYEQGSLVDVVSRRGDWTGFEAYLSGPEAMVSGLRSRLVAAGIEPEHIRSDQMYG